MYIMYKTLNTNTEQNDSEHNEIVRFQHNNYLAYLHAKYKTNTAITFNTNAYLSD